MDRLLNIRLLLLLSVLSPWVSYSQVPVDPIDLLDCVGAAYLCRDTQFIFPGGVGIDELSFPNNDEGCIIQQQNSAWFYIQFDRQMPSSQLLTLRIKPVNASLADLNFAIFDATGSCENLGSPLRCSYFVETGAETGLDVSASDISEDAQVGDGLLAPLEVDPGKGYFLLIDYANNVGNLDPIEIAWGGEAATYLNCDPFDYCQEKLFPNSDTVVVCQRDRVVIPIPDFAGLAIDTVLAFNLNRVPMPSTTVGTALEVGLVSSFQGVEPMIIYAETNTCVIFDTIILRMEAIDSSWKPDSSIVNCIGEEISLEIKDPTLSVFWADGRTGPNYQVLESGSYEAWVQNPAGCRDSFTYEVTLLPDQFSGIIGSRDLCPGETAQWSLERMYEAYEWSTGESGPAIQVRDTGDYWIAVIDEKGCIARDTISLQNREISPPQILGRDTICYGEPTTLRASGSFASYSWSTGSLDDQITVDSTGQYELFVTDDRGCEGTNSFSVYQRKQNKGWINGEATVCPDQVGKLWVEDSWQNVSWSNGEVGDTLFAVRPGPYIAVATDVFGCSQVDTFLVASIPSAGFVLDGPEEFCIGDTIQWQITGAAPQNVLWSDGTTDATLGIVSPDLYSVTVSDSFGCSYQLSLEASLYPQEPILMPFEPEKCPGSPIGLSLSPSWRAIQWSTGETNDAISVSTPGPYQVTAESIWGCQQDTVVTIADYPVTALLGQPTPPICPGDSIRLQVPPDAQNVEWSTSENEPFIWVKEPGMITVSMIDTNGCVAIGQTEVSFIPAPTLAMDGPTMRCPGESFMVELEGAAQSIVWSNGQVGNVLQTNLPGSYVATIRHQNGCSYREVVDLSYHEIPAYQVVGPDFLCPQDTLEVTIAPLPTAIHWDNGESTWSRFISTPGTYQAFPQTAQGCLDTLTYAISAVALPPVAVVGDTLLCAGETGTLSVNPGFREYFWSTGERERQVKIDDPGTFQVRVLDSLGCSQEATLHVHEVEKPILPVFSTTYLDCNIPEIGLTEHLDSLSPNWNYQWWGTSLPETSSLMVNPLVKVPGAYMGVVTNEWGCLSDTVTIEVMDQATPPIIELDYSGTLDCKVDTIVVRALSAVDSSNAKVQWYDDHLELIAEETSLLIDTPGTYYVSILDPITGCQSTDTLYVNGDFLAPKAEAGPNQRLTCLDDFVQLDGSNSIVNRGVTHRWYSNDGDLISADTVVRPWVGSPGTYFLEMVDLNNGCLGTDSVRVWDDRNLAFGSFPDTLILDCASGVARIEGGRLTDEAPDLMVEWSEANIYKEGSSWIVAEAGSLMAMVVDPQTGCQESKTIEVLAPAGRPKFTWTVEPPSCPGVANGQIYINDLGQGFTQLDALFIDGKSIGSIQGIGSLLPGTYTIQGKAQTGCTSIQRVNVPEPDPVKIQIEGNQRLMLGNTDVLQIGFNGIPRGSWNIDWYENGQLICASCQLVPIQPMKTTVYKAIFSDPYGCESTSTWKVNVEKNYELIVPSAFSPNGDDRNDRFQIAWGSNVLAVNQLKIFDRWGTLIYEESGFNQMDLQIGWDGNYQGQPLNPGVFVYWADVTFIDGVRKVVVGDVALVR